MELKGKTVAILVEDLYQELEVWYPLYRLREAGAEVVVVGTGKKSYKSKLGYEVQPNADINDVKAGDFDGIIIPGGYAPDILRRFPAVNGFVADVFKRGSVVAAICHGLWVCVSAGILKGRREILSPIFLTSSLKKKRSGSMSLKPRRLGRPPLLWWVLIFA